MKKMINDRLEIIQGDITKLEVDAVVNAANSSLMGGGGVDGAIHRAGGSAILEECRKIRSSQYPDGLPAGEAVMTTAGDMPAQHVIHTVGPVWHGGDKREPETLASAYRTCLEIAAENKLSSVAFPAISTGVYGFPKKQAAGIAYKEIKKFLEANTLPEKVILVFFSGDDMNTFIESIEN